MKEYVNNITKDLDMYTKYDKFNTYICQWKENIMNFWCIRFLGATRGKIIVDDDMVILEIELYPDTSFGNALGCYKESAKKVVNKYVGTKLELTALETA